MAQSSKLKAQKKGKLIIFSAPSGAGKTTIVKHLLEQTNLNLEFSISATSRKPRHNETHSTDYYFLSEKEFKQKIENKEFLEWEEVYSGIYYGTLLSEVERIRNLGKNVIFDVDVVGGLNIKKYYGEEALSVFVLPPSVEELRKRLKARSTETEDKINIRVEKAEQELSFAPEFDVVIINENIEIAFRDAIRMVADFLSK